MNSSSDETEPRAAVGAIQPDPIFHLSGLETPVAKFTLILVGDDGVSMRAAGSAVLIANALGLTAKHVIRDIWESLQGESMPVGSKEVAASFRVLALHFVHENEVVVWRVGRVWGSPHSDLALLSLIPLSVNSTAYRVDRRLALNPVPPHTGSIVAAFGFHGSYVSALSREPEVELTWGLNPATTQGPVLQVFESSRDDVMLPFPCFEINARFEGGMSGGPVFNSDGELCGIVCASVKPDHGVSHIAYAATLWPALGLLVDAPNPDLVATGPYTLADMGKLNYLRIRDLDALLPRIATSIDARGRERLILR